MGPRFGRGPRAQKQTAHPMPAARAGEIWCNIRQLAEGMVLPGALEPRRVWIGLPERQTGAAIPARKGMKT